MLTSGSRFSALLLGCVLASAPAALQRPSGSAGSAANLSLSPPGNVLVLLADDIGAYSLKAYGPGTDLPPTPNIDRMAASGVVFRNVWSQPMCSPTRATLQTGRYGFRTGIGFNINACCNDPALPLEEVTLPEMLDLGTGGLVAHAMIGKWHLGSNRVGGDLAPNLAGYGHFTGSMDGQLQDYFRWRKVVNGVVTSSTRYATSACVDDALTWIRQQSGRWVCVVAFAAPHTPYHAPPARLHTQTLPPGVPPAYCDFGANSAAIRPFYKAMVEALDTEIGRLLGNLPDAEHTTVLFLGDNGDVSCTLSPPNSRPAKATLYEGGLDVPLIASGYRVEGQGPCSALVNTADVFATVAELQGIDLSAALPGLTLDSVSFVPCLADPGVSVRDWIYADTFDFNGPGAPPSLPACPGTPVCQQNLGLDGPGSVVLESCGAPLYGFYSGNLVSYRVSGGPPFARGLLGVGPYAPVYRPNVGSWFASPNPELLIPFRLDSTGAFRGSYWTGVDKPGVHHQVIVRDPGQPLGFSVSNALRMNLLPTNMRAIRNQRYKLIRDDPCREELYDLATDPLERVNRLPRGLSTAERAAYDELSLALAGLR